MELIYQVNIVLVHRRYAEPREEAFPPPKRPDLHSACSASGQAFTIAETVQLLVRRSSGFPKRLFVVRTLKTGERACSALSLIVNAIYTSSTRNQCESLIHCLVCIIVFDGRSDVPYAIPMSDHSVSTTLCATLVAIVGRRPHGVSHPRPNKKTLLIVACTS